MAKIEDSNENYQSCIELLKKRLKSMGELRGQKEALHSLYADTILIESTLIAQEITNKPIIIYPELEIIGVETSSDVDYAIKTSKISDNLEELICITETKRNTENIGTIQNILQLENAFYLNKMQKTDRDSKDYYDYIYGIVTTADKWSFLMYTPENIYLSEGSYPIKIDKEELRNSTELRKGLKQVMEIIVGLLKDRIEVDDSFASKKNRVKDILDNLTC
ncbi:hypothetical protein Glove_634g24 [Diversispora epigaea]|uniref:Uncharacterized protein n=1 Tax=Diversispora epigaea TaxID=1348612 RepID=A0A397G676_9GLOM|nr:hypothetical protein Glove_634g24 [Diversispora epigaea]